VRSDFQAGEPLIGSVPIHEAYYWLGEDGSLHIALRHYSRSLLNEVFDAEWLMSIVLDGLPAGSQKLYRIRAREIRMARSHRGDHRRGQSVTGIVVVEAPRGGVLKGRFHAWVRQQQFRVLTGWAPEIHRAPMQVMVGEFEAVQNATRGQEILSETESEGLERPPPTPTATQPTPPVHRQPAGSLRFPSTAPAEADRP
jgi:hypothetical protein